MNNKEAVFTKSRIAGMELNNKIFRSATYESLSDEEGGPTEKLSDMYVKLAKGGVGAIITGLIGVQRNGRAHSQMCMIDRDDFIDGYKKINLALNQYGVPLIAQLAHSGGQGNRTASGGFNLAPSKKYYANVNKFSQVLSEKDILYIAPQIIAHRRRNWRLG